MNELAPRPSQPHFPIHNGLLSLWDMFEFRAREFIEALRVFNAIEVMVEQNVGEPHLVMHSDPAAGASSRLAELEETCGLLGANITADFVRDAKADVDSGAATWKGLAKATTQIYAVLEKELARAKLFSISPLKSDYFENAVDKFEIDVLLSFGSTMDDIDEAGKCFALGRNTACVFHLMRVMERPIAALGKMLLPDDPSPNWETVLKKIDAELARKPAERIFKGDVQFFAEVAAELRAVKHAWRNRVMHIDSIVTEERAKSIFDSTIGFMNVVSKRLKEDGLIDPNFELDFETPSQS